MKRFQNTRQPDQDWWEALWQDPTETLRVLGLSPGDSVADVGSGNGFFTLLAAELVDWAPVYAIDIDETLLAELSKRAETRGVANVSSVHGDARNLPDVVPEPVDVVLIANTFHGVEDRPAFVRQAYESLRPEGRLIVVNWRDLPRTETTVGGNERGPPEERRLSVEETREIIAEVFEAVEAIDLPPYHYAVLGKR